MFLLKRKILFLGAMTAAGFLVLPGHGSLPGPSAAKAAFGVKTQKQLEGTYQVDGRNSNGTRYVGRVHISLEGNIYHFRWDIAGSVYRGRGTLSGDILTVDWGSDSPVIYRVNADGSLHGTWANGTASERLRRIN